MPAHRDSPAFGRLCDAVAYQQLITVTGSGVSVGLPLRRNPRQRLGPWRGVLAQLRRRFAGRLKEVSGELDMLMSEQINGADYLIEAATLMREAVGARAFREAIVELTTPAPHAYSALHELIEELEPLGVITFNYDMGHEDAHRRMRPRGTPPLRTATYEDEDRLRSMLAGDFGSRFLLKAHGCISRPRTIVLDRSSYREVIARQRGYRAFVHHVLARFNALIVGFGLEDPDFDDLLQTFEANFGGGVRDHVYIWKRGQRRDEQARALVLQRRYGLACIFVDSFEQVREVIADARTHMGPKLRETVAEALLRGERVTQFRERRRFAHRVLAELSPAGAEVATAALEACAADAGAPAATRAEAAYALGKVRPTVPGTLEFLMGTIREETDPEIATFALAALLQLAPPTGRRIVRLVALAGALRPLCDRLDAQIAARRGRAGKPRARSYLEALLARWQATAPAR